MIYMTVELRNAYSRDGVHEVSSYEDALEMAKAYVQEKTEMGIYAGADIRWYDYYKGQSWLNSEISIVSPVVEGKWKPDGSAIVDRKGKLRKRLYVAVNKGCNITEHLYRDLDMDE